MKKSRILVSFKDKKFKYGGYAALLTGIFIALLVAVNLLVDQIPARADLTRQKLFTLSNQTLGVLKNLDHEVMIYGLFEAGKEPDFIDEILQKYRSRSQKVQLKYIDPYRNPAFVNRYQVKDEKPRENSLIVEVGGKVKVIQQYDLFNYSPPPRDDPLSPRRAQSLRAEQKITGAILYVTAEKNPTVYLLQGHQEESLPYEIRRQLEGENYILKDLDLLTEGEVPDDADILLVLSPGRDLTDLEEEKVRDFLVKRRGHAMFALDLLARERTLTNFEKILKSYGVAMERVLVFEQDPAYHVPRIAIGLLPEMSFHPITAGLRSSKLRILFPHSQAISELEIKRRTLEIEPLLSTSNKSWGKVDYDQVTLERSSEDPGGPFNVAVAITDGGERDLEDSRVVVTATSLFLYPQRAFSLPLSGPGNTDFVLNTLSWLYGKREFISIRSKSLIQFPLRLNQLQFFLFAGISVILIPLIILGTGLIIWLRRRHL